MLLKKFFNFFQIFNLIFLFLLLNLSNLKAHDTFNGGCREHCGKKIKAITNKSKLNNVNNQRDIVDKNSCLNKSLCRG